ncbi:MULTISPECIES: HD family phosphohydrolase [Porphyromonas]|uniref:HD family phosphohydrolase n=1 Tax=Porphyromonas TaxID=836 RepID=UPI00051DEF44|nr:MULTISPECIES: HDIG domain-containing metalloprotein [Porphyromonas]KGL53813.1 hypothetical protein HQ29_00110 [Porphyromonas canoris]KGN67337.1 hypothetical protein JT26_08810 [Porphyromonas sp. COT-108 OH1349]
MTRNRIVQYRSLALFILTAAIIVMFYPRRTKFKYQFTEGRPWKYELLTAPFDFPVIKTSAQIQYEKDSVLRSVMLYYTLEEQVYKSVKNELIADYNREHHKTLGNEYINYLVHELEIIYKQGILSQSLYDDLYQLKEKSFNIITEDNIAKKRTLDDVYTLKQAYEKVLKDAPASVSSEGLRTIGINKYLRSNLVFNAEVTDKVEQAKLEDIVAEQGRVQAGERIVGTGDVITPDIYMQLSSLKRIYESQSSTGSSSILILLGHFILNLIILLSFWGYLVSFRPKIISDIKNSFFFLSIILLFVILTEIAVSHEIFNIYILAYATLPILVRTFFDSRTALYAHIINVLTCSLIAPYALEFIIIQFLSGAMSILTLVRLSQRSDLIRSSFYVLLTCIVTYVSLTMFQEGDLQNISWRIIVYFLISFVFLMFTYVMVYVLERVFGYVSNISLIELSDVNTPMLRQLSEMAPGTFQHSLQVSILATSAAARLGADVQLIRTGALYHDIGKMKNPGYFTENQGNNNPHDKLPFDESAKIIIKHITDGIELAEKARLPKQVIDFIRTHHGLSKVKYFYYSYKNANPDAIIDESIFTYPGPNPYTKEMAILMLADVVEASSRSLKDFTEDSMMAHINKIIDGTIEEGLLKNSPLTFKDVEIIKEVFFEKLKTMFHSRISYPELKTRTNAFE